VIQITQFIRVSSKCGKKSDFVNTLPQRCTSINVGDLCLSKASMQRLENRKVLPFFYPDGTTSKGQQCKETSTKVLADGIKDVSVVCT